MIELVRALPKVHKDDKTLVFCSVRKQLDMLTAGVI